MRYAIPAKTPVIALMAGLSPTVESNYRMKSKTRREITFTEQDILGDPTMMTAVPDYSKFPPIPKNIVNSWMENGFYVVALKDHVSRVWFIFIEQSKVSK